MKLIILKEKLKEGLRIVEKISQKSLKLPILQNILFQVEKNILKLSTTNLESSINWQSLSQVKEIGAICVPIKILSNFISSLPEKIITIESDDKNNLRIECGNYNTKIKCLNHEDFPIIPQVQNEEHIIMNSSKFCDAINQIINIPSISSTKPEITGILLSFQPDVIKIVATDSFRLAEKKILINTGLSDNHSLILPQSAAKELIGIIGDKKGELEIKFSPNQVLFQMILDETSKTQIKFNSRLIEGKYPNYEEIIPKKYKTVVKVDKNEFLNQVKSASLFSGKINEVKMKISVDDKKIKISSHHPDLGEYEGFLNASISGKNLLVSFNYRFLIDGISGSKGDKIIFNLTDTEGPASLSSDNVKEQYLYIIMPIKAN